jgi:hypothetical protein
MTPCPWCNGDHGRDPERATAHLEMLAARQSDDMQGLRVVVEGPYVTCYDDRQTAQLVFPHVEAEREPGQDPAIDGHDATCRERRRFHASDAVLVRFDYYEQAVPRVRDVPIANYDCEHRRHLHGGRPELIPALRSLLRDWRERS